MYEELIELSKDLTKANEFKKLAIEYIQAELGWSESRCERVYQYIYQEYHSCWTDMPGAIDDLLYYLK